MPNVTNVLLAIEAGDAQASGQLLPLVYQELRQLAAQRLAQEKPGQTLQATALVHEAYLRLVGGNQGQSWNGRGHFFAAAAEAMRRILVDQARRRQTEKHGGNHQRVDLDAAATLTSPTAADADELLALNDALELLEVEAPEKAKLVRLRYFAGLTIEEAAAALDVSVATAKRHWVYARSWLFGKVNAQAAQAAQYAQEAQV